MLNQGGIATNGNNMFPSFVENNMFPQLQLFGNVPVAGSGTVNYMSSGQVPTDNVASINSAGVALSNTNFYPSESLRIRNALNLHHHHHQQQQQQNPVSTGLKLSYEEDERNSTITSATDTAIPLGLSLGTAVKTELHRQREEFNRFIKLQEQSIAKGVQEMSQRHTVSLLNALEKGINQKLHEKDVEIENMNKKNRELAEKIKQVAMEAQSWHCKAKYNESVVNTLKTNIRNLMAQGVSQAHEGSGESEVDDAVSCSNKDPIRAMTTRMACRACNAREVSVLMMPCRHLCLCSDCEGFVGVCPVCRATKTTSLHVYM